MRRKNHLSINHICIFLGLVLWIAAIGISIAVLWMTRNVVATLSVLGFGVFAFGCGVLFVRIVRKKLVLFSDQLCELLDGMMSGKEELPEEKQQKEGLFYKIHYRLKRLYEVMQENRNHIAKEREDLQELISDISHQVKTPIANLKMINNTLLEQEVPAQKQQEFLTAQSSQLDKLDFLMQAMIKTSRLETGVISLEQKEQSIYETLAAALGGIFLNAEKKKIDVQVDCPEGLLVSHDRKWTTEALFNILDNAFLSDYTEQNTSVAYTSTGLMREQMKSLQNIVLLVCGMIAMIMGFAGLVNFMNMMISSMIARSHEFATMRSIGMTHRQLKKLMIYEGVYYAVAAGVFGCAAAVALTITVLKNALNSPSMWFFTLKFTIVPAVLVGIVYLILAVIIPLLVVRFFHRGTVVEQLRGTE